jgi:hypothetical protein
MSYGMLSARAARTYGVSPGAVGAVLTEDDLSLGDLKRRVERLEAGRDLDPLEGLREFRLTWLTPLPESTPVPADGHVVIDFDCQTSVAGWGRPDLTFQFGTARERIAMGPEEGRTGDSNPGEDDPGEGF